MTKKRFKWRIWVAGALLLSLTVLTWKQVRAQDSYPHHAGIVIRYGDGSVHTACVDLGDDGQATGEEVLRAAGVSIIADYNSGFGQEFVKSTTRAVIFLPNLAFVSVL